MNKAKIKVDLKSWLFEIYMSAPAWYTILCCLSDEFARKAVIVVMVMSYFLLNNLYLKTGKHQSAYVFNLLFAIYMLYISSIENISSIIHLYFYSYFLMFIMFLLFLDDKTRNDFYTYFIKGKIHQRFKERVSEYYAESASSARIIKK